MGGSGGLERAGVRRSSGRTKKQLSKRSDELICINILTLEMSGVDRRPAKEGEEVGANEFSVCPYYMEPMHGLGERVLRARAVLGNLFPACCAAPPARMRQMQSPLLCARGCRAMFAACQGRVRAATCGARIPGRRALGWANCGMGGPRRRS